VGNWPILQSVRRITLWHGSCIEKSCQLAYYAKKFLQIIPSQIDPSQKSSPENFTRERKLPLGRLITFILSITASGKGKGVDVKSGEFFRQARRSGLWSRAEAIHRSALTKARRKIKWQVFRDILNRAVLLAYELWPKSSEFLWHGMSVFAIDGSKYTLPASEEIREEFDPKSGLQTSGKGHFPMCLVSTVYDVFRRLPIARTVVPVDSSEREEVKELLPFVPALSVLLFDRGYPSFEVIIYLLEHFKGFFIFRCPAEATFLAVQIFLRSGKRESTIWITPTSNYLGKIPPKQRKGVKAVKLRVVRLDSPDGTVSVLLTNLYDRKQFASHEIVELYFRRWEVESYYRDEKVCLEIERFHSKTCNSVRQELFAVMIMAVISRTLMQLSQQTYLDDTREIQFKNTIMTLASEAAVLSPQDPEKAVKIFDEILEEISRVIYYRPKKTRPPQPRVTKRGVNKWAFAKSRKLTNA